jgi:uncharacterized Fe-S cluster-containing radical SAM superfamily protein
MNRCNRKPYESFVDIVGDVRQPLRRGKRRNRFRVSRIRQRSTAACSSCCRVLIGFCTGWDAHPDPSTLSAQLGPEDVNEGAG